MKRQIEQNTSNNLILYTFLVIAALMLIFALLEKSQQPSSSDFGPVPEVLFCQIDNCTLAAQKFMESAQSYLHCAFYDLDLHELKSVLEEKSKMMDVRLYIDNANYYGANYSRRDRLGPLMHNKYCVADGKRIFTGSFNPTPNDAYKNDNNLVIIESQTLASNYEENFVRMWNATKASRKTNPVVSYNGKKYGNYFCPAENCAERIIDSIYNAQKSIYFMTFSFTDKNIASAIVAKHAEGIEARGVFETRQVDNDSVYGFLKFQGIDVRMDRNRHNMHHKVFIIDNATVIFGSMNPTNNGNKRNDENIIIAHDADMAQMFASEFFRVLSEG